MKLARKKDTGEWILDFQRNATAAGLIANAVRSGIPEANIEIVDVSPEEYNAAETAVYSSIRSAKQVEERADKQARRALIAKLRTNFGLTDEELRHLPTALREI